MCVYKIKNEYDTAKVVIKAEKKSLRHQYDAEGNRKLNNSS